jgi:hypothetical protein
MQCFKKEAVAHVTRIDDTRYTYGILVGSLFGKSRYSSVGIALGYGLDDRGSRIRFPAGAGNFSLRHHVQNGSGAHPAYYIVGTTFPRGKAAGV